MTKLNHKNFSVALLATFASLTFAVAQVAPQQGSAQRIAFTPPKIAQPLPFKAGEVLVYEINFSKLIFSGTIGELKLTVAVPADSSKPEMIELRAEAVSRGFFPALFGLRVKDRYTSLVDPIDFGVSKSIKLLEEGKSRRDQTAIVDRANGRINFTDRDLANPKNAPRIKEKPSPVWVQDLLSTIYFVRTQPLNEGDVVLIPISDGGEVYNIEVIAGKRLEVKTGVGKFKTIELNAKVFDGRYIRRSGEMLVYITDDANRIPVRARVKTSGATVTVDLKRVP